MLPSEEHQVADLDHRLGGELSDISFNLIPYANTHEAGHELRYEIQVKVNPYNGLMY